MEEKFYLVNQVCLDNIINSLNSLADIETKGDSTLIIANTRRVLYASIQQIQSSLIKDETGGENGIINTNS